MVSVGEFVKYPTAEQILGFCDVDATTCGIDLLPLFPENAAASDTGELTIGGVGVTAVAEQYGTPAYVIDEMGLRAQARRLSDGLTARRPNSAVVFASKALPCVAAYALLAAEGLQVDVAGGGELAFALAAGVSPERIYLHGNAKTDAELAMALQAGVGTVVIDNFDDIGRIERYATRRQPVLVRVIPGVDPVTHESQSTGGNQSKFGLPIDQAREAIARIRASAAMRLDGLHLHIGSQILDTEPFARAIAVLSELGEFPVYDIGGGLGVRYTLSEQAPSVDQYLDTIADAARTHLPSDARLLIEPGRSLVARSCMTLYRVTTVKRTGRVFVAVDGGMGDNLEPSLTGQRFEAVVANRMNAPVRNAVDLVGRHCESGDRLIAGLDFPEAVVGDLVAVPVTGAYGYTLANNYNGALKPPIVFCRDGEARLVVQRESYEHLLDLQKPALANSW